MRRSLFLFCFLVSFVSFLFLVLCFVVVWWCVLCVWCGDGVVVNK